MSSPPTPTTPPTPHKDMDRVVAYALKCYYQVSNHQDLHKSTLDICFITPTDATREALNRFAEEIYQNSKVI